MTTPILDPDIVKANEILRRLFIRINGVTLPWNDSLGGFDVYDAFGLSMLQNPIMNGSMIVAQRGTSLSVEDSTLPFTLDRWRTFRDDEAAGLTVSQQDRVHSAGSHKAMRLQRDAASSGQERIYAQHTMPTIDAARYGGRTVTLSCSARKGANYSGTATGYEVFVGSGIDESLAVGGFTSQELVATKTITPSLTWSSYVLTFEVPVGATQIGINLFWDPSGTAGANDWLEHTDWTLTEGTAPMPPSFRPFQQELALCRQFYRRVGGENLYDLIGTGFVSSATTASMIVEFPERMIKVPTLTVGDVTKFSISDGGVDSGSSDVALGTTYDNSRDRVEVVFTGSALTTGRSARIYADNSLDGYLAFEAEI